MGKAVELNPGDIGVEETEVGRKHEVTAIHKPTGISVIKEGISFQSHGRRPCRSWRIGWRRATRRPSQIGWRRSKRLSARPDDRVVPGDCVPILQPAGRWRPLSGVRLVGLLDGFSPSSLPFAWHLIQRG
jgi:hypothetical protein